MEEILKRWVNELQAELSQIRSDKELQCRRFNQALTALQAENDRLIANMKVVQAMLERRIK